MSSSYLQGLMGNLLGNLGQGGQASVQQAPAQSATPSQDALNDAVAQAKQQWPRLADWDVNLTTGKGPYMSETYFPDDPDNPSPGSWNIQLRNPKTVMNKGLWPEYVGLESLHWLQDSDPKFQDYTEQFIKSMTPEQDADAYSKYVKEVTQAAADARQTGDNPFTPDSNLSSYDKWLRKVQALEYIRGGGLFPKSIPNWVGPQGEGRYTPDQMKLMGKINDYLKTPASEDDDQ